MLLGLNSGVRFSKRISVALIVGQLVWTNKHLLLLPTTIFSVPPFVDDFGIKPHPSCHWYAPTEARQQQLIDDAVTSPTLAAYGDKWRKNLERKDVPETASHLRVVYMRECFSSISLSPEERDYHDSQDLDVSKDALNLRSISQASVSGPLGPSFLPQLVTTRATRCQVSGHVHNTASIKKVLAAINDVYTPIPFRTGETARDREERYLAPDAVRRRRAASLPAFRKLTIFPNRPRDKPLSLQECNNVARMVISNAKPGAPTVVKIEHQMRLINNYALPQGGTPGETAAQWQCSEHDGRSGRQIQSYSRSAYKSPILRQCRHSWVPVRFAPAGSSTQAPQIDAESKRQDKKEAVNTKTSLGNGTGKPAGIPGPTRTRTRTRGGCAPVPAEIRSAPGLHYAAMRIPVIPAGRPVPTRTRTRAGQTRQPVRVPATRAIP
ncbi:hypothetical protein GGX14DRAFT_396676 [Mycena pura]|uniref:Uncharacterized protein n=1 Tax=Mycena pura TaxID=153505 RepID=A0AAD6VBD8_9AGAR|nr:hypothetical protein GGX14DRAFT_396676 [Mycena pura]